MDKPLSKTDFEGLKNSYEKETYPKPYVLSLITTVDYLYKQLEKYDPIVKEYDFNDGNGLVYAHKHINGGGWVADTATVVSSVCVNENAVVYGKARVYGDVKLYDNVRIYGNARVYDDAKVAGDAQVFGDAQVYQNAQVFGNALVHGKVRIYGNAEVYGDTDIKIGKIA